MTIHTFKIEHIFVIFCFFLPKMRTKTHVITFVPGIINRLMMKSAHTFVFKKKIRFWIHFLFILKSLHTKLIFHFIHLCNRFLCFIFSMQFNSFNLSFYLSHCCVCWCCSFLISTSISSVCVQQVNGYCLEIESVPLLIFSFAHFLHR